MYQVGIVGCGGISRVHSAVLDQLPETKLVACADIRPERAQAKADQYGCRPYASLEDMLAHEKLDAVHICTPHYLHTPMAQLLADKGIPVFMEKPPVINRAQWAALEEAAKKVPLGVCFQNRYNPNVREAKRLIEAGVYGAVVGARAFVTWKRLAPYYVESGWRGAWETEGGGVLINQSVHTLDLLVQLMGAPTQVEAHMANHHLQGVIEVEDTLEAYLMLGGKPALFYATTAYTQDAPVMVEIQLEQAVLRIEENWLEIRKDGKTERQDFAVPQALGKGYWGTGHLACIQDFYHSLTTGEPFQNNLDSVRDTAEAMLKIYEQGRKDLV